MRFPSRDTFRSMLTIVVFSAVTPAASALQSCPLSSGYLASPPTEVLRPTGMRYTPVDLLSFGPAAATSICGAGPGCGKHYVYLTNAATTFKAPLFVFLPGTSMEPNKHELVLQTAAYAGYRTIGLSYDNTHNVENSCLSASAWPSYPGDCYRQLRDEIIEGVDYTSVATVEAADSILHRLYTLLAALYDDDLADGVNDDGWDVYFNPVGAVPATIDYTNFAWDQIIIAGFSQGAGHAAKISKAVQVQGTVMLDGPGDLTDDGGTTVPAEWLNDVDASAGRPRYGVMHAVWSDALFGVPLGDPVPSWTALGIGVAGVTSLDKKNKITVPWLPGVNLPPVVIDLTPITPPANASYIDQTPATVTASGAASGCLNFPIPGFPADTVSKHGSMADDRCMPTTKTGGVLAESPETAFLFPYYLKRFCYACEASVCP